MHWSGVNGDTGKTGFLRTIMSIYSVNQDSQSREHLILNVQPENFGTHGCSDHRLFKAVRCSEITVSTLTGPLCRVLLEGCDTFKAPVKGDNVAIKSHDSAHHCIVFCTSNIPTLEEFRKVAKEAGHNSKWTSQDYERNLGPSGSRMGVTLRLELPIPQILRREIFECPRCGALYIRWCVRRFLTSMGICCKITKENTWVDSDAEEDKLGDEELTVEDDFDISDFKTRQKD